MSQISCMRTVCIVFATGKTDFIHSVDRVEFKFVDSKDCFVLNIYCSSDIFTFIFDEIELFNII